MEQISLNDMIMTTAKAMVLGKIRDCRMDNG